MSVTDGMAILEDGEICHIGPPTKSTTARLAVTPLSCLVRQ
jgi:hypothetical protein